jgi:hypothetical protein
MDRDMDREMDRDKNRDRDRDTYPFKCEERMHI